MGLLLAILCYSFLLKYASGTSLKACTVDDLYWGLFGASTLGEFQTAVEAAIELNCHDFLESIPSMTTPEKRIWYFAKYYGTTWEISPTLFCSTEAFHNVHSILLADNPEVLECFPEWVSKEVTKPINLATYDAVNIARTLPARSVFTGIDLGHFHATRIISLQEQREARHFDLALAIQTRNLDLIQHYIDIGIWRPTMDEAYTAFKSFGKEEYLLFLLKNLPMPPGYIIIELINDRRSDALQCILSSNPDWKARTRDVSYAVTQGLLSLLEWYASVSNDMPLPSLKSLEEACRCTRFNVVEWFLKRYYQDCLSSFNPGWKLGQEQVDTAVAGGFVHILNWVFEWFLVKYYQDRLSLFKPFMWRLEPNEVDNAVIQGCITVLKWNAAIDPTGARPSANALTLSLQSGHVNVIEWVFENYSPATDTAFRASIFLLALEQSRQRGM
ncbi:hypothetical protein PSACC_01272 [Paramicrosporidium saccamoebae]|uniref:Uncharacterized protein n=1 Tax=Paramicrosporidium saccamoebae TaxID=1246581 RepID=A0A2H9TMH5_9FUNG|nr:hypothetical protein PSACC_01272 [Paramicrosporidium saccamoebae]